MKCDKCGKLMDCLDDEIIKNKVRYEAYICWGCNELIEKLDNKIIGKECEILFVPVKEG